MISIVWTLYQTLKPERTHNTGNDDNDYTNDNEYDENGGDDDNGPNLFDMASTLRTSRKSPLLWSMFPPGRINDHTMVII